MLLFGYLLFSFPDKQIRGLAVVIDWTVVYVVAAVVCQSLAVFQFWQAGVVVVIRVVAVGYFGSVLLLGIFYVWLAAV